MMKGDVFNLESDKGGSAMKKLMLLSVPVAFAVALYGCGGQGSSTVGLSTDRTGPNTNTQPSKTAVVTFKANFPKKGEASKSLIDPNTASIVVHYQSLGGSDSGSVTLTPDNPSATVRLLPTRYQITAYALDANENILEVAGSAGQLAAGTNTVLITFLNGKWTFVNQNDEPSPITLSDGLQLDGFLLYQLVTGSAAKAAFDMTKPMYSNYYGFTWASGGFTDLTRNSYLTHTTQFLGGDVNNSSVNGGWYNLTKNCGECDSEVGDTGIVILGELMGGGDSEITDYLVSPPQFDPDITQYRNSKVLDGTHITGTLVEVTVAGATPEVIFPVTGSAAKALTSQPGSRTEALRKALSGVKKSQTNSTCLNSLTAIWYDPVIVCRDKNGDGQINYGNWVLGTRYTDKNGVEYYEWGYLPGGRHNPGECGWGLEPTDPNNLGEWEDYNDNGIADPWEFYDKNGDGTIDFGSFRFTHYLKVTETFSNVCAYPFRAKGEPLGGTTIQVR